VDAINCPRWSPHPRPRPRPLFVLVGSNIRPAASAAALKLERFSLAMAGED
jgi:hypothetical protein